MYSIGITGGICCGKTEFSKVLRGLRDLSYFDADACVRHHLENNAEVAQKIRLKLGTDMLDPTGLPDRNKLRDAIYYDEVARKELESILHPYVWRDYEAMFHERSVTSKIIIADIPLIYETKSQGRFDMITVLACSPETQIRRLKEKRGISGDLANKMLSSQFPLREKMQSADCVIWNDGSLLALKNQSEIFARNLYLNHG